MNNLSWVENRLRDLKPRIPSPDLKERIFSPRELVPAEPALTFSLADVTRWLVPVMGCFLVALASLGTRTAPQAFVRSTNDLLPQSGKSAYAAYVGANLFHSEMNSVPVTRVERNFGPARESSARGVLQLTTNLMQ